MLPRKGECMAYKEGPGKCGRCGSNLTVKWYEDDDLSKPDLPEDYRRELEQRREKLTTIGPCPKCNPNVSF